ncbi:MAG TPA: DNA-formamidopyrimidine glycosylase family protein [Actinomycetota bacterium]
MPEGDTIHAAAARLRAAFADEPLERFEAPRLPVPHPSRGETIEVTARGKHLLLGFSGGRTLHTHLGMDGWWRVERSTGRAVPRGGPPGRGPQARIATAGASAVVGGTPTVELLDAGGLRRHPVLAALGPDLCDPDPDLDEVLARLRGIDPATPIGVVLLDQSPACGIGNVYRSEVLWFERTAPRTPLDALVDDDRRRLYATAHRLLRANLGGGPRRTVTGGLAVYERGRRPCLRCRTAIRVERLGEHARPVWWCPACQTDG